MQIISVNSLKLLIGGRSLHWQVCLMLGKIRQGIVKAPLLSHVLSGPRQDACEAGGENLSMLGLG